MLQAVGGNGNTSHKITVWGQLFIYFGVVIAVLSSSADSQFKSSISLNINAVKVVVSLWRTNPLHRRGWRSFRAAETPIIIRSVAPMYGRGWIMQDRVEFTGTRQ